MKEKKNSKNKKKVPKAKKKKKPANHITHLPNWLLYLLTNQIAQQSFLNFQVTVRLPLGSEDGFHTGCRNFSRQGQSFSGLQSP